MNRDDIIRMAREADIIDFRDVSDDPHVAQMVEFLERFAALVAASERKACALTLLGTPGLEKAEYPVLACAQAIRARGTP